MSLDEMIDSLSGSTNMELQGELGELLVKRLMESFGYTVFKNPDKYGTWDLIITKGDSVAKTIQVKTTTRYITKDCFKFHIGSTGEAYNTLRFCDILICVVRDSPQLKDTKYGGKIVVIENHKDYPMGRNHALWIPSNDNTTTVIGEISQEELNQLNSYEIN